MPSDLQQRRGGCGAYCPYFASWTFFSTDGSKFTQIGSVFTLDISWSYFLGYRYAIFNYTTTALGGSVTISSFEQTQPQLVRCA